MAGVSGCYSGGDGDGELHAAGAVPGHVADEVVRAGGGERDGGGAAVVVAQRVGAGAGAGVVAALGHLRHRVRLAHVPEHCSSTTQPLISIY